MISLAGHSIHCSYCDHLNVIPPDVSFSFCEGCEEAIDVGSMVEEHVDIDEGHSKELSSPETERSGFEASLDPDVHPSTDSISSSYIASGQIDSMGADDDIHAFVHGVLNRLRSPTMADEGAVDKLSCRTEALLSWPPRAMVPFWSRVCLRWESTRVYEAGCRVESTYHDGQRIELVARFTNVGVDPFAAFYHQIPDSPWLLVREGHRALHVLEPSSSGFAEPTQSFIKETDVLCNTCNNEFSMVDLFDPDRNQGAGVCSGCGGTGFSTTVVSSNGKEGDLFTHSVTEQSVVYDPIFRVLRSLGTRSGGPMNIEAAWAHFREHGSLDGFAEPLFLDDNIGLDLESLLWLELRLHKLGAELYRNLRQIPVSQHGTHDQIRNLVHRLQRMHDELDAINAAISK